MTDQEKFNPEDLNTRDRGIYETLVESILQPLFVELCVLSAKQPEGHRQGMVQCYAQAKEAAHLYAKARSGEIIDRRHTLANKEKERAADLLKAGQDMIREILRSTTPYKGEGLKEEPISVQTTVDAIMLVCNKQPVTDRVIDSVTGLVRALSQGERQLAIDWAAAVMYAAADTPNVVIPHRPYCLMGLDGWIEDAGRDGPKVENADPDAGLTDDD